MFHLLTLPFRLAFGLLVGLLILPVALLVIPFVLFAVALKLAIALVVLPFVIVAAMLGVVCH